MVGPSNGNGTSLVCLKEKTCLKKLVHLKEIVHLKEMILAWQVGRTDVLQEKANADGTHPGLRKGVRVRKRVCKRE